MTDSEFVEWLDEEVLEQRMTSDQRQDLLDQKALFDGQRTSIELEYRGRIAAYVADQFRTAQDLQALIRDAQSAFPTRMIYFEPIDFDLF